MFETAELGQVVDNAEFKKRELKLRAKLLALQYELRDAALFPVVVDITGVDGAGKGTTINMLNKWMDPRWLRSTGYLAPTGEERGRPRFWRYWRDLPKKGLIGVYLGGRYSRPLQKHVYGRIDDYEFDERLSQINRFEDTLADDGALIVKIWMHLSQEHQKKRLETLSADPLRSYMVDEDDWRNHDHYDQFIGAAEKIITRTHRAKAPWHIVEGVDPNFRHLRVGELLVEEITRHLDHLESRPTELIPRLHDSEIISTPRAPTVFDRLDMSVAVSKSEYRKRLPDIQARLGELGRQAYERGQSTVLIFEGPDASGKGGAIRRTVWSLDARAYRVHQFAAPTPYELAYNYLRRFWTRLPQAGHVAVFDRSWYGRVLVERVEGLASEEEWRRAYNEINEFENQMIERGMLLLKFWLQISKEEQLKRFEKRRDSAYKRWKLTDDDWRNRDQWDTYESYGNDVVEYTSTKQAPWILIEGDSKHHARLTVMQTVIDHLQTRIA